MESVFSHRLLTTDRSYDDTSMKIMKKDHGGTQIDGPIFTTAGDNTRLCLVSSLMSEYI
jgi:hypothetical protein